MTQEDIRTSILLAMPGTAEEIAKIVGISEADVQQHLDAFSFQRRFRRAYPADGGPIIYSCNPMFLPRARTPEEQELSEEFLFRKTARPSPTDRMASARFRMLMACFFGVAS